MTLSPIHIGNAKKEAGRQGVNSFLTIFAPSSGRTHGIEMPSKTAIYHLIQTNKIFQP